MADERAILRFAYDWRLSVAYNGGLLAEEARRHLDTWTATVTRSPELRGLCTDGMPRLVFVAHSMGGLVTRSALARQGDLASDTRTVITLGTPFLGAAKAALMLNGGRNASGAEAAVRDRAQAMAATMPGVYDLVPDYRCVDEGRDVIRLTPAMIAGIGGDPYLGATAAGFREAMRSEPPPRLPDHRAVYGTSQPTVQSIRIDSGVVHPQHRAFRADARGLLVRDANGMPVWSDRQGDGTVYRDAASGGTGKPVPLPLQHGALAKDRHALAYVHGVLTEQEPHTGPPMAPGELGLDLPDAGVIAGRPWRLRLTGRTRPTGVTCEIVQVETGATISRPRPSTSDGGLTATVTLPVPGLYRVGVHGSDRKRVTQFVMVFEPEP
ncbi:lipase/acyltransferase domain-containing protein [Kitasatospora nipponensis]|uniref:lipase/acyltransferase domain-containing protein n=1 Tax=Kitasatospora nipponensis TaxID=258049 RepID=UPI0031D3E412